MNIIITVILSDVNYLEIKVAADRVIADPMASVPFDPHTLLESAPVTPTVTLHRNLIKHTDKLLEGTFTIDRSNLTITFHKLESILKFLKKLQNETNLDIEYICARSKGAPGVSSRYPHLNDFFDRYAQFISPTQHLNDEDQTVWIDPLEKIALSPEVSPIAQHLRLHHAFNTLEKEIKRAHEIYRTEVQTWWFSRPHPTRLNAMRNLENFFITVKNIPEGALDLAQNRLLAARHIVNRLKENIAGHHRLQSTFFSHPSSRLSDLYQQALSTAYNPLPLGESAAIEVENKDFRETHRLEAFTKIETITSVTGGSDTLESGAKQAGIHS